MGNKKSRLSRRPCAWHPETLCEPSADCCVKCSTFVLTDVVDAAAEGSMWAIRMVLGHPRFTGTSHVRIVAMCAAYYGNAAAIAELIKHPLVDPHADNGVLLECAATGGHADVVRVLLDDGNGNPGAGSNAALQVAAEKGFADVVQLLLDNPYIDPAADDNRALEQASARGHLHVVTLLLKDPRVRALAETTSSAPGETQGGPANRLGSFAQPLAVVSPRRMTSGVAVPPRDPTPVPPLSPAPLAASAPLYVESGDGSCAVCMEGTADVLLMDSHGRRACGHISMCAHCAAGVVQTSRACPMCRAPAASFERLFLSRTNEAGPAGCA